MASRQAALVVVSWVFSSLLSEAAEAQFQPVDIVPPPAVPTLPDTSAAANNLPICPACNCFCNCKFPAGPAAASGLPAPSNGPEVSIGGNDLPHCPPCHCLCNCPLSARPSEASPPALPLRAPFAPSSEFRPYRGLYLDAQLGLGELRVTFAEHEIAGTTFPIGLKLGIAAASNLVVFGELYEAHVFRPIGNRDTPTTLDLFGFGPGLKYYLNPTNAFLSGSLLLSTLSYGEAEKTHWGVTGRFSMGKGWWIAPNWSLGLAGEVLLGRMEGKNFGYPGERYTYTAKGFSLVFSGSFSYPPPESADAAQTGALASAEKHTHDGFYLNARLGHGWLWLNRDGGYPISGSGYPLALSAGFALTPHLVLFAEFYRASILNPTTNGYNLANLDLNGFGPGLTYYLVPRNIFLSSTLLLSKAGYLNTRFGNSTTSPRGVTGRLSLGKEWWISGEWGLGFAVEGLLGRMDEYKVKGFSLLASASFN